MRLSEVMRGGAITCSPDSAIDEVADMMKANSIGVVVVVDHEQRPIGVVTDRDIALRSLDERNHPTSISGVMSTTVATLPESADVHDAIRRMADEGVRRIPVVSSEGRLVGLLSMGDLLKTLTDSLMTLVNALTPEDPKIIEAA